MSPGHPATSLTHDYLRRLADDPTLVTAPNADLVGHPSIELIRAVIATHLRADHLVDVPLAATLQMRILEYVRANLHDPNLCAGQIAAVHYISVRYLYKVLADSGISLADWIRTRRLEGVRQTLASAPPTMTVATVARRHGFTDMSSFGRTFRTEFGVTPQQWRGRHLERT